MSYSQPRHYSDLLRLLAQFCFQPDERRAPTDEAASLHYTKNPLNSLRCRHVQGYERWVEAVCPILPSPARTKQDAICQQIDTFCSPFYGNYVKTHRLLMDGSSQIVCGYRHHDPLVQLPAAPPPTAGGLPLSPPLSTPAPGLMPLPQRPPAPAAGLSPPPPPSTLAAGLLPSPLPPRYNGPSSSQR